MHEIPTTDDASPLALDAGALAQAVRDRRWRCTEVTAAALRRIDTVDRSLHAFCTLAADAAMAQAESLDARLAAGQEIGALGGVPVAIKDLAAPRRKLVDIDATVTAQSGEDE